VSVRLAAMARRNFISALWHGAFLALGTSLTQPTTVIAAFVADLTGSTVWVGGLSTVLTVAGALFWLWRGSLPWALSERGNCRGRIKRK
jgi:hypothetical protein